MSRVEEIERAIESLPAVEFRRIALWIKEREQEMWDRQLDQDSGSGALDSLFREAEREAESGTLREWPPV